MNKTLSYLAAVFAFVILITSCNKNDFDFEAAQKEQAKRDSIEKARIDDLIKKQAADLKLFADEKMAGATLIDSLGIWFIVDAVGQEDSYSYRPHPNGGIIAPEVTVKYKGTFLDGSVFDQTETDKTATFSLANTIRAWQFAFLPKEITYNGNKYPLMGLTNTGLKKGSKIRFVTSSPWAYDAQGSKDSSGKVVIPANTPLYFEIEVIDIK